MLVSSDNELNCPRHQGWYDKSKPIEIHPLAIKRLRPTNLHTLIPQEESNYYSNSGFVYIMDLDIILCSPKICDGLLNSS